MPAHPLDVAKCPSAVAISPSGDCILAVHRRIFKVMLEILVRTTKDVFVSVQTIDVSHYTTSGNGEPSLWDDDAQTSVAHELKLPYRITFSACGRFAALVDQRPMYGLKINNSAVLVIDMAYRLLARGVRALPLADQERVAPRTIDWTSAGLWIQGWYGALFLSA